MTEATITKETLSKMLAEAYESGFHNGIGAVELSCEDGLEEPDDTYKYTDDTVKEIIQKYKVFK